MLGDREQTELAVALADMARDLLAQDTVQGTLDRIVVHAVKLISGCDAAGIMVVRDRRVQTLAATSELVRKSDRIQDELSEGPCFDAARHEQDVYRIGDMASAAPRWPGYAQRASDLGIGSVIGYRLFTAEQNLGALDFYSTRPHAFTESSEQMGWLLASHAAVGFASARNDAQLREAISTRQDIGEALGIIMERYRIGEDEAFAVLRKASQDHNIKLRDLARTVTETGAVPGAG